MNLNCETVNVLSLNVHKKDKIKLNDFADFNAQLQLKNFVSGRIFYFSESVNEIGIRETEERIRQIIKEKGISIVFFAPNGDNYELSIEFFAKLKEDLKVKNVLWVLDDELIFDIFSKYYAQVFDAVITCDYFATFAYTKMGVPALYFFSNFSKQDFYPVNVNKDIDISFVGDCTKADRLEYIKFLKENGINIKTYGDGSENGFLKKEEMILMFSRSKINLNFTKCNKPDGSVWYIEDNNLINLVRQNKGRPMELSLTDSFCLSEYTSSLGHTFEIGKDIDVFYDKEDLLRKVRYYLKNEDLRVQMANNAYTKAITIYEADIFMPRLMDELCEVLNNHKYAQRDPIIYKDSIFKKNHTIKLSVITFYQLSKFKIMPAFETFTNLFQYGITIFMTSFCKGAKLSAMRLYKRISRYW